MPRKNERLPYLQLNRVGRLSYVRRIAPELRQFLGGRAVIRRSLGLKTTDCRDAAVIAAWNAVNAEVEAEISQAKAQHARQSGAITEVTSLSPRDIAGIGAQPWRELRDGAVTGDISGDLEAKVIETVMVTVNALLNPATQGTDAAKAAAREEISDIWLTSVLNELSIEPSDAVMQQIRRRYQGYLPMAQTDGRRLKEGDFQTSDIESKPPALPKRKVTWEQVLEQYSISVGGTTESDGQGVGQDRIAAYKNAIADFIEKTGKHFPDEATIDEAREYANALQASELAIRTQQKKFEMIKHLYKVAVEYGLLNHNPLLSISIKRPKGSTVNTYRPFTRDELVRIFNG